MNPPSTTPKTSRDLSELVTAVFVAWREAGVAFLVLRNYEHLPQDVGNDIDVLVRPMQLHLAERVMVRAARETGFHLHNRAEFSPVSYFFHHPDTQKQIQIDLFFSQQWRGFDLLPANAVLDRRTNRGLFSIPHPVHEAVADLLTRLMFHGYVKENYKEFIAQTAQAEEGKMEAALAEIFGKTIAGRVMRAIATGRWGDVEACYGPMRRQLIWRRVTRHPWRTLRAMLRDQRRFLKRWLRPPGLTVALIGPDGCGKSSVADRFAERMLHTFRPDKSVRVHWKPAVFFKARRAARPPTTNPHGTPPRNALSSLVFLGYHWTEYVLGGWLHFLPVRFRNGMVLVDRYYYDFAVDPRRYRLRVAPGLVRFLFRFVPQPDLVFLLDAPTELLQARKAEVPPAETQRQREAYGELIAQLPNGHRINAAQPLDQVVAEITGHTLKFLRERSSRWQNE
jgi:thymidylate kinase